VDAVVVGVGVMPNTAWLAGSGLAIDDGVVCDGSGAAAEHVYAAGDVARMPNAWTGDARRVEHWTSAVEQAAHVAANALAGASGPVFTSVPYFWSDQYDRRLQFAGDTRWHDEMVVVDGRVADRQFTALYRRGERLCACLAINQPRALAKYRRLLASHAAWADAIRA
jgi:NADPH-dependent 2,4-dienoyl-CoA reductase/sulfur reductase-like enzyme